MPLMTELPVSLASLGVVVLVGLAASYLLQLPVKRFRTRQDDTLDDVRCGVITIPPGTKFD